MPAAFLELSFQDIPVSFFCPITGRVIVDRENGFDVASEQTPHLRFVFDWVGEPYLADPSVLPAQQQDYQRRVVRCFSNDDEVVDEYRTFDDMIEAVRAQMPATGLVVKVVVPGQGSQDAETCWVGLDLAPVTVEALAAVELVHGDQLQD